MSPSDSEAPGRVSSCWCGHKEDDHDKFGCAPCRERAEHPFTSGRVPSRKGKTLVPGHTLRNEGAPHAVNERGQTVRLTEGRYGRGLCSCGELSDLLDSNAQRKRWHARHKSEVRP